MRWFALGLAILVLTAPRVAAEQKRSFIAGFPPYVLGTNQKALVENGPKLTPGSRIVYSDKFPTARYSTNANVFLGGSSYRTEVSVEFWDGKLAVVILHWPQTVFQSVNAYRARSTDLYLQLLNSYDASLIKSDSMQTIPYREQPGSFLRFGGTITLVDTVSSQLIMRSDDGTSTLTLVYVWGQYKLAVDRVPQPTTRF